MKRVLAWIAWSYVAAGVLMFALYLSPSESIRAALSILAIVSLIPAAVIASRIHRFPKPPFVILLAVAVLYIAEDVSRSVLAGNSASVVSASIDLVANALIIAVVAYAVSMRRGRFTAGDLLDGVMIGSGGWLVAWIVYVQPYLGSNEHSVLILTLDAMYLPLTMPLLALGASFLFSGLARRPATWLLVCAVLMNVAGDALYAAYETRHSGVWTFTLADATYLLAFIFGGAAIIHPTSPELVGRAEHHRRMQLPGRMAITGVALLVPMLMVALIPVASTLDRIVRAVSVSAVLCLALVRLFEATRSHLRAQARVTELAMTDALTGLPNKAAMLERTADTIDEVWRRTGRTPSVYLFDLDRFKNINDSLGHEAGDAVLKVIADRLTTAADSIGCTVGRPTADEFVVLDPTTTSNGESLSNAEFLLSVFKQPLSISEGVVFVTSSVGVSRMPAGRPSTAQDLFRWADIAMYRAKDAGRNCLALYHTSMQQRVAHRMEIETALHGALDRREMRLFHQPIVDIASGRVSGFEALIRWQRDDGSMMSPADFIPIAEETGMISSIGSWALLEAMTLLRRWIDDGVVGDTTAVSVNVSPRQLADPHFTDTVSEALRRSGLPPDLLWLEITESIMISEPDLARATLQRIRATGVRIALDDFGTGYSSLSLLQQFPIQRIKIDRAFISGVADSSHDRSLVRTILAMGDSMGLDVVAEGVETIHQLKLLQELGCPKAQGFLISHPVPAEAMRSTIAALESLAQWPEFRESIGPQARPRRSPIAGA